jgi:16S rRNA (uracil1498-N3)-methyltransferase
MTRLHRIFTDQPLQAGHAVTLADEAVHYLSRVLRVAVGQRIVVFNGDGRDYPAEIAHLQRSTIGLQLLDAVPACAESPLCITLVQAISRGERMDMTLQKATELGVAALQPVFAARTEVRLEGDKLARRMQHWRKVVIAACEQSGRGRLPALLPAVDVAAWAQCASQAKRLLLSPGASVSLAGASQGTAVELLVGPEGGFEPHEEQLLQQHGAVPVHLGPRILRTETAGPAAIAVLQSLAGDFS